MAIATSSSRADGLCSGGAHPYNPVCPPPLGLVYPYEHRPAADQKDASAIIETSVPFQLLFLNNSFHYIHHRFPGLPWYYIRGLYESNRSEVLQENGDFVFKGYRDLFKKYALRPKDSPVFPEGYEPPTVASSSPLIA
jgi:fatty acid desaturase